ncbi:hypothetical protein K523DRAFT_144844 [Schizophyllum commune Tattone D]|nr:hypothetical protein K523DRAFT_144844 [Schizophyllum commune Tattone D]
MNACKRPLIVASAQGTGAPLGAWATAATGWHSRAQKTMSADTKGGRKREIVARRRRL